MLAMRYWTGIVAVLTILSTPVLAQDQANQRNDQKARPKSERAAKKPRRIPEVFRAPEVDAALPNVLLIGDSISMAYTLNVRKSLEGKANVFRPPINCGPTTRGVEQLDGWLGDRKWSVIHFNFGLHDLKYMGPGGQNLADPKLDSSKPQVAPDDYRENLKQIAKRLKKTGAEVVWRETTPVPEGAKGRVVGDAKKYNAIAAEVMKELGGIHTDPFFKFSEGIAKLQRPANVHYTPEGAKKQADHVARQVLAYLPGGAQK